MFILYSMYYCEQIIIAKNKYEQTCLEDTVAKKQLATYMMMAYGLGRNIALLQTSLQSLTPQLISGSNSKTCYLL